MNIEHQRHSGGISSVLVHDEDTGVQAVGTHGEDGYFVTLHLPADAQESGEWSAIALAFMVTAAKAIEELDAPL